MNIRSNVLACAFVSLAAAAAIAAARPDGAVIHNTGSTNTLGYTIKVWSNGRVQAVQATRTGEVAGQTPQVGRIDAGLAQRFFADTRASRRAGTGGGAGCMKSASFGSSTTVTYHGWTSADLECPGNPALGSEVHAIAQTLHLSRISRRPMLPNEPRRPEGTPAQPTASPESRPVAP